MSETVLIVTSKLRPGASRELFLELSAQTKMWLHRQSGFLRYELFEGEGSWTDTMVWASAEAAEASRAAFGRTDIASAFSQLVEPDYRVFSGKAVQL